MPRRDSTLEKASPQHSFRSYQDLRIEVNRLVGEINGKLGTPELRIKLSEIP
jgi:trehalose-6-phosphate synthase